MVNNNNLSEIKIDIREENFDVNLEIKLLTERRLEIGAIVSFLGLVRDTSKNNDLKFMEIEHYPDMTEKIIRQHCEKAFKRWSLNGISLIHRIGKLYPGENIVSLIVASSHRGDAFNASEFLMDFLKSEAPFWKKETSSSATNWVEQSDIDKLKLTRWL